MVALRFIFSYLVALVIRNQDVLILAAYNRVLFYLTIFAYKTKSISLDDKIVNFLKSNKSKDRIELVAINDFKENYAPKIAKTIDGLSGANRAIAIGEINASSKTREMDNLRISGDMNGNVGLTFFGQEISVDTKTGAAKFGFNARI